MHYWVIYKNKNNLSVILAKGFETEEEMIDFHSHNSSIEVLDLTISVGLL